MKTLLSFIIAIMLTVSVGFAQSGSGILRSTPKHVPTDTVVNTATKNQGLAISIKNKLVTVQTTATKISGTAAGVIRLYGSLDGVSYARVNPTDSLVVTNIADPQSKIFVVQTPAYSYYRISYTGSGTMSVKLNSIAAWRE